MVILISVARGIVGIVGVILSASGPSSASPQSRVCRRPAGGHRFFVYYCCCCRSGNQSRCE
jgi:hypothetical protein